MCGGGYLPHDGMLPPATYNLNMSVCHLQDWKTQDIAFPLLPLLLLFPFEFLADKIPDDDMEPPQD